MRKLVLMMAVSLDGLVARPGKFGAGGLGSAAGGLSAESAKARLARRRGPAPDGARHTSYRWK